MKPSSFGRLAAAVGIAVALGGFAAPSAFADVYFIHNHDGSVAIPQNYSLQGYSHQDTYKTGDISKKVHDVLGRG